MLGLGTDIGRAGQAWLQTLAITLSAVAMALHLQRGGRLIGWTVALLVPGVAVAVWHTFSASGNTLVLGPWVAAAVMAVALHHLASWPSLRALVLAGMLAMVGPLLVDALLYVLIEHPQTVQSFRADEARFLEQRGMEAGSTFHRQYERRLLDAAAVGPFGLANVFATVMLGLGVTATALALFAWRQRSRDTALLMAAIAAAAALTVWLTGSRGGIIAWLMLLPAVALVGVRLGHAYRHVLAILLIALVGLACSAVLYRGSLGPPPTAEGERSLLFRYHYWQGAAAVMQAGDATAQLVGVGPLRFQHDYPTFKPPLSPEDVQSTHNVFVDLWVSLGLAGLAWAVLLLAWIWRAAHGSTTGPGEQDDTGDEASGTWREPSRPHLTLALGLGLLLFGVHAWTRHITLLTTPTLLAFFLGLALFTVVMAWLLDRRVLEDWRIASALACGAAAVLVHSQIEMGFFHVGASGLLWALTAVAAAAPQRTSPRMKLTVWSVPLGLLLLAIVWCVMVAIPTARHQAALGRAATALHEKNVAAALVTLREAQAIKPDDLAAYREQIRIHLDAAFGLAGRKPRPTRRIQTAIHDALSLLDEAGQRVPHEQVRLLRLRADVHRIAAMTLDDLKHQVLEVQTLRELTGLRPHDLETHRRLADLLWLGEQRSEAREVYEQVLAINARMYLDPARQMSADDVADIKARLR